MDNPILHCDLNGFFASVECYLNPAIRNLPVVVGGDEAQRHGIVLAKNEHAKIYGIVTGETLAAARRKCPDLFVTPAQHGKYEEFSQRARDIYHDFSDRVEPFGIDEAWLDVSCLERSKGNDSTAIAHEIRERIKTELGITCSIGVSWNKPFAKLGSDYKKPDAVTVITRNNFKDIVWPLPVGNLLYAGAVICKKLEKLGIKTIGALALLPEDFAGKYLGKIGYALHKSANGNDLSPVDNNRDEIKSVGNSTTLSCDLKNGDEVKLVLLSLSDKVAARLRKYQLVGKTVQITVRDEDFAQYERQAQLPCHSALSADIYALAWQLFLQSKYSWKRGIRLLGVKVSGLLSTSDGIIQQDLFEDGTARARKEQLETCIDKIRDKYGKDSIARASLAALNKKRES